MNMELLVTRAACEPLHVITMAVWQGSELQLGGNSCAALAKVNLAEVFIC